MKRFGIIVFGLVRPLVDPLLAATALLASLPLKLFRWIGPRHLPLTRQSLLLMNIFPLRSHYYDPAFHASRLAVPLDKDRHLPGIDLHVVNQLILLKSLSSAGELREMGLHKAGQEHGFAFGNGAFESGDAELLYQVVRHFKPQTVIEVGSGHSTRIAHAALGVNCYEEGSRSRHILIEPYEHPWLSHLADVDVRRHKLEDTILDFSKELTSGDLLFIDSSHIIRPQGDVLKLYLEVLPVLAPGVIVHIHDIFTPRDYLIEWLRDDVRFWNEQYLLEALLTHSDRYEVILAANYLKRYHYTELLKVCPYLTSDREPGSFYIRIREPQETVVG